MRRVSHNFFATIFSVVSMGLITNVLLVIGCFPLVALLVMTDPMLSWPYLAVALVLSAPALAGAFRVFAEHDRGGDGPLRAFWSGWRAGLVKPAAWTAAFTVLVVVLLVDVRALSSAQLGVLIVPVLLMLTALAVSVGLVGLVALAEVPTARLRDVLKAAGVLALRRWYLTAVSLLALVGQAVLFTAAPALAIGLAAAPVLYLVWANTRFTLRPVLDDEGEVAAPTSHAEGGRRMVHA